MRNILIDTGFWFALYNSHDQYHIRTCDMMEYINTDINTIIILYPTLYETINTKFSSDIISMEKFKKILEDRNVFKLPDDDYRKDALDLTFKYSIGNKRNLSLADNIIRLILDSEKFNIDYLITFNVKDFSDVCKKKNIKILT